MDNSIKSRRKALGLSQKKLADLVSKEARDTFSYQALQKVEAGGKTVFMHNLLTVLEREEQKKLTHLFDVSAQRAPDEQLLKLARQHSVALELFDALSKRRRKYIIEEMSEQLQKQRDSPSEDAEAKDGR